MRYFQALFLLVIQIMIYRKQVEAVCCGAPCSSGIKLGYLPLELKVCGDCSLPTPYCSYGNCNVFGCSCEEGCKPDKCHTCERGQLGPIKSLFKALNIGKRSVSQPVMDHMENLFEMADGDKDGLLSEYETMVWYHQQSKRDLLQRKIRSISEEFQKIDSNGDGFLSRIEIDK